MSWIAYAIAGLHALGALGTMYYYGSGEHRGRVTGGQALLNLVVNGAVIAGVLELAS